MASLQRNRIGNGIRLSQTWSRDLQDEDDCQVCHAKHFCEEAVSEVGGKRMRKLRDRQPCVQKLASN